MKTAGDRLVESIIADLAELGLAPDSREAELLAQARDAADRIAELKELVGAEGSTYTDKHGTVRPSPLLAEIRLQTLVLTRCLGGIQMNAAAPARNPAKVRAGQASWRARSDREHLKAATRHG